MRWWNLILLMHISRFNFCLQAEYWLIICVFKALGQVQIIFGYIESIKDWYNADCPRRLTDEKMNKSEATNSRDLYWRWQNQPNITWRDLGMTLLEQFGNHHAVPTSIYLGYCYIRLHQLSVLQRHTIQPKWDEVDPLCSTIDHCRVKFLDRCRYLNRW